jgi:AcrR family transcriptional regulator
MGNLSPETARRILETASHLFAQKQFDEVRMEDLANGARISKVTLYRYFPTKDDLYLKLLEEVGRDYLSRLREAEASARGCRARLVALTRTALRYFDERHHLLKLLDRAGIDRDRGEGFPWLAVQQDFFRMVKGLFAEGVALGEFLVDDLDLAVRGLLGTMRFQFLYPCRQDEKDQIPDRIIGMLTRPVSASSSARAV